MKRRGLPLVARVTQEFAAPRLTDIPAHVRRLIAAHGIAERIPPGARIAITAGSRGIRDMSVVLRTIVEAVRAAGGDPFLVPCMGSHGGATASGQARLLASLGITERSIGAPIVSSMKVVGVGTNSWGSPVVAARDIVEADGVIVVNRIKRHTDFSGTVESGLVKMLVVGVGKRRGAEEMHRLSMRHGHQPVLLDYASHLLAALPVLCGIGIIENQLDETAEVHLLRPEEIVPLEPTLLARSRELAPSLPFDELDCLIVDEIGKEISGGGMDTTVIGRIGFSGTPRPERPRIRRIFVRDLTAASHGNALGIGLADFTTDRLLAKVDRRVTALNCITSSTPEDGRLPIAFARDLDALDACYVTSGPISPADFSLVWIKNTLSLSELVVSIPLLTSVGDSPGLVQHGPPFPLAFDDNGNLVSSWGWSK